MMYLPKFDFQLVVDHLESKMSFASLVDCQGSQFLGLKGRPEMVGPAELTIDLVVI
jgi:hypothetical protein